MSLVSLSGATARLAGKVVLNAVDLTLPAGELVAVCGQNGSGKSSLMRVALGLLPLATGLARLGDAAVHDLTPAQRARRVAYLAQERQIAWNMSAVEIAALGAPFLGGGGARDRALAVLADLDAAHLAERGVADMSGGERARVMLARALVTDAPALLADEPIAGLDPDTQMLVLEHLRQRARNKGAVLVSLHDLNLAARYADRIMVLSAGRVIADDIPSKALTPAVLAAAFQIRGDWIDTPLGPVLRTARL